MADKSLKARLGKLFSSNIIVRHVGSGNKLRVADSSHVQAYSINQRDRYSRLYGGMSGYGINASPSGLSMAYQSQRLELFRDYDLMDSDGLIAAACDIYADESGTKNEYGEILTINSEDDEVKEILHNLFYDILNIEFNLWPWTRNLCKYGDFFLFLEISEKYGIHNVIPLSVYETTRVEGQDAKNPYYVKFETTGQSMPKATFENYEIAHFRLLSDSNFMPYGKSQIESARRVWKQMTLAEDAMLIHRIMRAPEKRIFKIDIGNIAPAEVDTFMERTINKMKKVPLQDKRTGDYDLRYNMMNMIEDFYLPVRGKDTGTEITSLKGLEYSGIDDINYLKSKVFAALKIPKAFLGYDENINGKLTLAAEDVRFARTIERIQRIIVSELTKIAVVHLFSQGFEDEKLVSFDLQLTNPSTIAEQEKLSLWKEKVELTTAMQETKLFGSDWIYQNVFEMSDEDIEEQKINTIGDAKRIFRISSIEGGQDPAKAPPAFPGEFGRAPDSSGDQPGQPSAQQPPKPVGRPDEGVNYDQDSHPRGRDPLGHSENNNAMKAFKQRESPKRKGLSLESYGLDVFLTKKNKDRKGLLRESVQEPQLLNEEALLDVDDID